MNCDSCYVQPDYPNLVLSNGTVTITMSNRFLSRPGFSTAGVEITAYNSFSHYMNEYSCAEHSTKVSLRSPIFVPSPTSGDFVYPTRVAPFAHDLNPDCSVFRPQSIASSLVDFVSTAPLSTVPLSTVPLSAVPLLTVPLSAVPLLTVPLSTVPLSTSNLTKTIPSLPPVHSTVPSSTIAPATGTARLSATSHTPQSPFSGSTETKKLIIGLVVAVVVPVLLIAIGLSSFCIVRRRRRRRKDEPANSPTDVRKDEGEGTQLYFQQKVELDDEQRRHEMEAVELRYEMEGEDMIHELPGAEGQRRNDRQELPGEEHARELENSTA